MGTVQAALIDTVSIQQYIFGSNKLKENIGASFLVKDIYQSFLERAVKTVFPEKSFDLDRWQTHDDIEQDTEFGIGYIGGGNALLLFQGEQAEENIKTFTKAWTKLLLLEVPGVIPAIAYGKMDLSEGETGFKKSKSGLFQQLDENKSCYTPQTVLPKHGITAQCSRSGLSIEADYQSKDPELRNVSSVARAKMLAIEEANERLAKDFAGMLDGKYVFTDQLDDLGQSKDEDSHIAIVHIDGNNMGELFKKTKALKEIRQLSVKVNTATRCAFETLLTRIIAEIPRLKDELQFCEKETASGKKMTVLPIRPIVLGGDDVTFVCDGRVGIYFAGIFLQAFFNECKQGGIHDPEDRSQPATACAGIAVTKSKYPFYRGYLLAEDLCKNAKRKRHEQGKTGSWLDFHIAYGGFSGTLEAIREEHYISPQGDLLLRPYRLTGEKGFESFVRHAARLKYLPNGDPNFPNSKLKDLRDVLSQGENAAMTFIQEQTVRGRTLPLQEKIAGKLFGEHFDSGPSGKGTPYFDMLELLEIYPDYVLRQQLQEVKS